jgi:hypothetical protein
MLIRSLGGQDRRGAEILQSAGETMSDDEGRQFFKRLWEHDLLVFDTKGAQ